MTELTRNETQKKVNHIIKNWTLKRAVYIVCIALTRLTHKKHFFDSSKNDKDEIWFNYHSRAFKLLPFSNS